MNQRELDKLIGYDAAKERWRKTRSVGIVVLGVVAVVWGFYWLFVA